MSQRDSGYTRKERDCYETPYWVTEALKPHILPLHSVWEPACGSGKMVRIFRDWGIPEIFATDIAEGKDFFSIRPIPADAIITNPPYENAQRFIERALHITYQKVAMLLRTDFDHAKTRKHLFGDHRGFAKKLVLTRRIRWFENSTGSPSFNHAWFIWDAQHKGPPTLAYYYNDH